MILVKVLYVAKHDSGHNDDEGAICHSLEELGWEVVKILEKQAQSKLSNGKWKEYGASLLLFHHWSDPEILQEVTIPKVFWYFDLVTFPDETIERRNCARRNWMAETIPHIDLGFCTDGDWVAKDKSGKLCLLRQGADSRVMGVWPTKNKLQTIPLLFTGMKTGGKIRRAFFEGIQRKYGQRFINHRRCYKQDLGKLISQTQIVIAPDGPITNRYWSNGIYMTLGFGGFLLHPYCADLAMEYEDEKEVLFYKDREQLHEMVKYYQHRSNDRNTVRNAAFIRTQKEHTYTHRCRLLIYTIQERLF